LSASDPELRPFYFCFNTNDFKIRFMEKKEGNITKSVEKENSINIAFVLKTASEIKLRLWNAMGEAELFLKEMYEAGVNIVNLSTKDLEKGEYVLEINGEERSMVQRIVIQ
jgi:hypothetical protein